MKRAAFWSRAAATGIDLVGAYILAVVAHTVILGPTWQPATEREEIRAGAIAAAALLVWFFPEVLWGRSLGKLALRLVIARADAVAADRWTRVLRYSTKHFGWICLLLFALTANVMFSWLGGIMNGLIAIGCLRAFGEDRVAWHDIWCHTAVFAKHRAESDVLQPAKPDESLGAPQPT